VIKTWPVTRQGFASVIFLLIIVGSIIAVLAYAKSINNRTDELILQPSATPDPFGNWKTYKNKTHGFSIRYPKEWFIKPYQDYAADFLATDPRNQEASPSAIKVRYLHLTEKVDLNEFEKIQKSEVEKDIYEPLDVKSVISKVRNLEMQGNPAIEFYINRQFSALEGPRGEFSHVYEIKKGDTIFKFLSYAQTKVDHQQLDPIFQQMISSLNF